MNGLPRTANTVKALAEDNGWSVLVMENEPDENFPNIEVHTTLLMERDGTAVGAFWHDGRFDSAVVQHPPMKLIQRDLKDLLSTPVEEFGFDPWPPDLEDDPKEKLRWEYEACGYYISGHPLDHINYGAYPNVVSCKELEQFGPGERVQILGIVEEPTVKQSRRGYWLCFFGVSDQTGYAPCFGFGIEYKEMDAGSVVLAKGEVEERNGERQIKVKTVREVSW